jgi:cytochrome c-type biogenesis protein CcmH
MMFWLLLAAMTLVAAVGLSIPLFRRPAGRWGSRGVGGGAVEVLKGQLADIDAQAPGQAPTDARDESLRIEIERRILAEGAGAGAAPRPLGERSLKSLGIALVAIVALAATALYLVIGRPDLAGAPAPAAVANTAASPGADFASLVAQLETKMERSPGDPMGWRMLGWSYMQMGRYARAAGAFGRASALDPTKAEYPSAQGEALTQAAGGQVTAAARSAFATALAKDPGDPRARYFLAMAKEQSGDHAGAMADWIALVKSAPPDAPWVLDVRAAVEQIAKKDGEDIAGRLPPAGPAPAARSDSNAGQAAMIAGMVDRLAARLKANPKDSDGWIRLMRARMVLGEAAAAQIAYHDALEAYADSPSQQAAFRAAARGLHVPGA